MGFSSYIPGIGITKAVTGKSKVHLLRKLSRKHLKKAWFAKHPSGFMIASTRGRIETALNKLTKREIAELIAFT